MIKAKSCPFCGSAADELRALHESIHIVRCSNRECIASFKSVDVEVWNTRTTPAVLDWTQFELLMRRYCTASPGDPRAKARAALLEFLQERQP